MLVYTKLNSVQNVNVMKFACAWAAYYAAVASFMMYVIQFIDMYS